MTTQAFEEGIEFAHGIIRGACWWNPKAVIEMAGLAAEVDRDRIPFVTGVIAGLVYALLPVVDAEIRDAMANDYNTLGDVLTSIKFTTITHAIQEGDQL